MTKYLISLIVLLGITVALKAQQADSLLEILSKMPDDTAKISAINRFALDLDENNLEESLILLRKGKQLALKTGALERIPDFDFSIGRNHANQEKPDSALLYFEWAKAGYIKQHNVTNEAEVLSCMRWVYNYLGDFTKAYEYGFASLSLFEKNGDETGYATEMGEVGHVLFSQGKIKESVEFYQKSYQLQSKLNIPLGVALAATGLGDAYQQLKDLDKALAYQNEALAIFLKLDDQLDIATAYNGRGNALRELGRYKEAMADYQKALKMAREIGFKPLEINALHSIGSMYSKQGRFREALPYHLQIFHNNKNLNKLDIAAENYMLLADAYAGLGRYDSAFYFRTQQLKIQDSLQNAANNARMNEIQTQYSTAQKEAEIRDQKNQIAVQRTRFGWAIGILALALFAGFWLFRLTRQLRKRNTEKEFLIKEIHHRVKNNLQILSSLLHLQSRQIKDETALDAVREGQNRVDAMGLIHQKLYMGENLAAVEMQDYLANLGATLLDSFGVDGRISIQYEVEHLILDVDTAIPLGLIINELLTNSLKYAFPEARQGIINLALWKETSGSICLRISDNGAGKNAEINPRNSSSFGTNLIQMLSKKLKGKPEISANESGYATFIRFG